MFNRRTLLAIALAFASPYAAAQATNNDYYQARSSKELSDLLGAVEKYHIQPGIEKMRTIKCYGCAWGDFDFILRYFPNHPRGLLLMAQLCELWRSPQCNMQFYFDNALQRSPENAGIYLTQGIYLQKRGKLDEAIASYKKSIEINPDSINAQYNLGLAYAAKKQYALANEHAQRAYAGGLDLPGLRSKLVAVGAWKPIEPKPAAATPEAVESTPPKSAQPSSGEPMPIPAEVKAEDGGSAVDRKKADDQSH